VVDCVVAARRLAGWSLWVELAGLARLVAFWEASPPLTELDLSTDAADPETGELPGPCAAADPDLADRLCCLVAELQLPADVYLGDLAGLFVTSEISAATGASPTATGLRLDAARALFLDDRLPRTRALLRAGLLDWTKLRTLLTGTADLHPDVARAVEARVIPDADLALATPGGPADPLDVRADPAHPGANLPAVTRMTNPALTRALRAAIAAIDADALTERAARARTRRHVRGYPTDDSMGRLEIEAAQEAVAAVMNDLDATVAAAKAAGDTRTPDQIRTDTAITRLTRGTHGIPGTPDQPEQPEVPDTLPDGPGAAGRVPAAFAAADSDPASTPAPPPGPGLAVSLTMTLSTWLGLAEDPAVLDRYGAIPAALARRIAREAARDHPTTTTWRCIITGDDHRSVLGVADPMRTPHHNPPPRLARLVDTIHPRCVFPGCPRTARLCDRDHRTPYEDGGPTCSCNLQPLCRSHHRLKSIGLITAQPLADPGAPTDVGPATDTLAWTTAHGRTYRYEAPPPVPEPADPHARQVATAHHHSRWRERNSMDPDAGLDPDADITRTDDRSWRTAAPSSPTPSTPSARAEQRNGNREQPEARPSFVVRNDPPPF
jgi:hypothetical protein